MYPSRPSEITEGGGGAGDDRAEPCAGLAGPAYLQLVVVVVVVVVVLEVLVVEVVIVVEVVVVVVVAAGPACLQPTPVRGNHLSKQSWGDHLSNTTCLTLVFFKASYGSGLRSVSIISIFEFSI